MVAEAPPGTPQVPVWLSVYLIHVQRFSGQVECQRQEQEGHIGVTRSLVETRAAAPVRTGRAAGARACLHSYSSLHVGLTGNSSTRPHAILLPVGPVDALYENGLLRPVSPLPLRSGERVTVIVVRRADASRWDVARLVAHGDDDLAQAEAGLDEWAAALDCEDRG